MSVDTYIDALNLLKISIFDAIKSKQITKFPLVFPDDTCRYGTLVDVSMFTIRSKSMN